MANKQTKKAAASRRAKIEAARKAERARQARNRTFIIIGSALALAALVIGVAFLISEAESGDGEGTTTASATGEPGAIEGSRTWEDLSRNHVEGDVDYPMTPPAGGDHAAAWLNCDADVYQDEVNSANAVHSLEHGAVWVTYNDSASDADVEALTERVSSTPYSLMSPLAAQDSPIVLTAWGNQLALDTADDPRVDEFFTTFVQGEQTPEPGAACTGGISE
ncbi:DUF3105 domain-containing protein [Streptomyces radicis]|uniref:DUF3105 domain-containing protein n=1 Tax=Streptomyces radicis TaxID=1750517 RepID=A0A3A9VYY9_9ACTN|nr:DUF3105 domain-containing protein [Streptomyces radicis]RKN05383.1 DUF3105 domain-containing protein [Streptomyces radicis]RKN16891.1 DUF3105 domain-containing protein [Streptomyces radicis]